MTQDSTQSVLFHNLFHKPVVASFDQPDSSSDGGAILLKAIDSELGLTERLANCIREIREEGKIVLPRLDLLRQRVYGIACGYPDCNDADRLADDPIQKMLLDRIPLTAIHWDLNRPYHDSKTLPQAKTSSRWVASWPISSSNIMPNG